MSQDNGNDKNLEPKDRAEQRNEPVESKLHADAYPQRLEPNRLVVSSEYADVFLVVKQNPTGTETLVRLPAMQNDIGEFVKGNLEAERDMKRIKIDGNLCYYDSEGRVYEKTNIQYFKDTNGVKHEMKADWFELSQYRVLPTDTLEPSISKNHYTIDSIGPQLSADGETPSKVGRIIEMKDGTIITDDGPEVKQGKAFKVMTLNDKYVTRIDGKAYLVTADGQVLSQNERGQFISEPRFDVGTIGADMESALQYVDKDGNLKLPTDNMTFAPDGSQVVRESATGEPLNVERAINPPAKVTRPGGAVNPFSPMQSLDQEKYFDFGSIIKKPDGTIIYDLEQKLLKEGVADGGKQPFTEKIPGDAKVVRIHGQAFMMTQDGKVISQSADGQFFIENRFQVESQSGRGEPLSRYQDAVGKITLPRNYVQEFREGYKIIKEEWGIHRIRPDGTEVKPGEPVRQEVFSDTNPKMERTPQIQERGTTPDVKLRPIDRLTESELRDIKQLREAMEAKPNLTPQQMKDVQALRYLETEMGKPRPDLEPTIREVRKGLDLHRIGRASGAVMLAIIAIEMATKRGAPIPAPQPRVTIH